ncbi:isochorismate synthase [Adhaeribacter soli]|uniref:Isochorismate synthase n=2 Tax=Adhaeribacter soli TaxID=2607655 RepID=A0A5N1J677_9BACT|nr:isochorismate synthase [Adhaeribacter soli]
MHPFTVTEENKPYFLEADLLFQGNFRENHLRFLSSSEKAVSGNFFGKLQEALQQPDAPATWHSAAEPVFTASKSVYEELVQNGIDFLKKGNAEKVVPSRCAQVALSPHFRPVTGFFNLLKQYPHAFVSLVSAPETGTWLGASPEILVVKDKKNIFRTMALAGTQKLAAGLSPADAIWRQKEIEEQSMVVRYVISCFKKIRLREYVETGPRTVAAGNLLHLRSDFCVPLNEEEFPNLTSRMLHLLHPTSAVCGQPKEAALDFLNAHENYNRRYYSGYLGPVNVQHETAVYVNLRCLELRENSAILYAGAGVTVDSDPTKEWQETELKMQTVSAALQLNTPLDDTATGY